MNTQRLHLYKNIYVAVHIRVCHVIDPIVTVLVCACWDDFFLYWNELLGICQMWSKSGTFIFPELWDPSKGQD